MYIELPLSSVVQENLGPITQALIYTLQHIQQPLEERVFASVVRGLWDNVSKELYSFVLDLRENMPAQVSTLLLCFSQTWGRPTIWHCAVQAESVAIKAELCRCCQSVGLFLSWSTDWNAASESGTCWLRATNSCFKSEGHTCPKQFSS